MHKKKRFRVTRDSREQKDHGWLFSPSANCEGTDTSTLPTGDYTLQGFEEVFIIERKGSVAEFYGNVFEDRFEAELLRLEEFKYPFIILEFTLGQLSSFPYGSGIPKSEWPKLKANGSFLLKKFWEYQFRFKTRIIPAGKKGKEAALSLFKRVVEFA